MGSLDLSPAMANYLEAILIVATQQAEVRSVDIARQLNVSKPSVWRAVTVLKDDGLLIMDNNGFLQLTNLGERTAEAIYDRHCYFKNWLIEAGVEDATAEQEACRIEHDISEQSFQKLKRWKELGHSEEANGD